MHTHTDIYIYLSHCVNPTLERYKSNTCLCEPIHACVAPIHACVNPIYACVNFIYACVKSPKSTRTKPAKSRMPTSGFFIFNISLPSSVETRPNTRIVGHSEAEKPQALRRIPRAVSQQKTVRHQGRRTALVAVRIWASPRRGAWERKDQRLLVERTCLQVHGPQVGDHSLYRVQGCR